MKKIAACLALVVLLLAAGETHVRRWAMDSLRGLMHRQQTHTAGKKEVSFSQQIGKNDKTDMIDVTLYFRFEDTGLLGAQSAQLDIRREETVASSIVQQLIDGPSISHSRLNGLFPQGTEVISVSGEDTTAFVTLSRSFLGKPDGAPADWEDSPVWQAEAALRRYLAVQSLVLSLTEGGRYQRVQLYVADSDDDIPERVPLVYFNEDVEDKNVVLAASARDESVMLTPGRAMQMIMDAWKARDYETIYTLLAPAQGENMPTLSVFVAQMNDWDISLLSYSATQGTVSIGGQTATVVVDAEIRSSEGGDAQIIRESVPLVRRDDNWAIAVDTLQSLMIRD